MKKIMMRILCGVIAALLLFGCKAAPTPASISLDQSVLAYASPMAENIMDSLKNNNYQGFRANYDDTMMKLTSDDQFQNLRAQLEGQFGAYKSISPKQIQKGDGYINVFYTVNFEKGSLTMQLVLTEKEPHQISGLWFK